MTYAAAARVLIRAKISTCSSSLTRRAIGSRSSKFYSVSSTQKRVSQSCLRTFVSRIANPDGVQAVDTPRTPQLKRQLGTAASINSSANTSSPIYVEADVFFEGNPLCGSSEKADGLVEQLEEDSQKVVQASLQWLHDHEGTEAATVALLSVVLCDDDYIQQLNREHRGKDSPTDVLSFGMADESDGVHAGSSKQWAWDDWAEEDSSEPESAPGDWIGDEDTGALSEEAPHSVANWAEEETRGEDLAEEDEEETETAADWGAKHTKAGMDGAIMFGPPPCMLGDLVVSLDTAARQAQEMGHSLRDEVRVLLVHGVLHLAGLDHERGPEHARSMAEAERHVLAQLGWQGKGLITTAQEAAEDVATLSSSAAEQRQLGCDESSAASTQTAPARRRRGGAVKLVALDMDGTLLDGRSRVLPSSVAAIRAALAAGVTVCLATGKARPAAMRAMDTVGLHGDGLVVSSTSPGLFLQGLAVHGRRGALLRSAALPRSVVEAAFLYSQREGIPLSAFLGDTCVTTAMAPELQELHDRYYEPLSEVQPLSQILAGPSIRKLLFMTEPAVVDGKLKPYWEQAVQGQDAETMQAVETMLEIVPRGINKWTGMRTMLADLGITAEDVMAVGDGSNDLQMVANVALGVAMGNAVPQVKEAAAAIVASNDEDGIAEAFERFVL